MYFTNEREHDIDEVITSPQPKIRMSEVTNDSEDAPGLILSDSDPSDAPDEDEAGRWLDKGDGRGNDIVAIKYRINKSNIESTFEAYAAQLLTNGTPDEATTKELFDIVFKFAEMKIRNFTHKFRGAGLGADTYAMDVVERVIKGFHRFKGNGADFYKWLAKICWVVSCESYNEMKAEFFRNTPLFTMDDYGEEIENPLIYSAQVIHERSRPLPEWIAGKDRMICGLIQDGLTYRQIGEELGLTQAAVTKRMERLFKQAKEHNYPKQHEDALKEWDRKWADAKGPIQFPSWMCHRSKRITSEPGSFRDWLLHCDTCTFCESILTTNQE